MIVETEIREKLDQLLSGGLDLEAFEDWFVERSWNMHLDSAPAAQDLASAVELALSEHSAGHLSERELHDELRSLRGEAVKAPRSVARR